MPGDFYYLENFNSNLIYANSKEARELSKELVPGQQFTIAIKNAMIAKDYDWLSDNDILITSSVCFGENSGARKIHYYKEDVKPLVPLIAGCLKSENIFLCEDFTEEENRLHINIEVFEIDRFIGRKKFLEAMTETIGKVGACFPSLLPYTVGTDISLKLLDKVVGLFEKDKKMPFCTNLYLEKSTKYGAILNSGIYVIFADNNVKKEEYSINQEFEVYRKDGNPVDVSYVVITIEPCKIKDSEFNEMEIKEKLILMLNENSNQPQKEFYEELSKLVKYSSDFKKLKRLADLKGKSNLNPEEKKRKDELEEKFRNYLPELATEK